MAGRWWSPRKSKKQTEPAGSEAEIFAESRELTPRETMESMICRKVAQISEEELEKLRSGAEHVAAWCRGVYAEARTAIKGLDANAIRECIIHHIQPKIGVEVDALRGALTAIANAFESHDSEMARLMAKTFQHSV